MSKLLRRIGAALAVFTILGFAGTAAASASTGPRMAPQATPACAASCFSLSSLLLGHSDIMNAYVHGNLGTGGKTGVKVSLKRGTDTAPNQDWTASEDTTLAIACTPQSQGGAGLLSPAGYACMNFGDFVPGTGYTSDDPVFEADWSPFGNQTQFCAGAAVPAAGENVTLRACGQGAGTLWVADESNAHIGYTPWILGSDPNTSHPLVLTVLDNTRKPQDQLKVTRENLLTGGFVANDQMFTLAFGVFI